MSPLGYESRSLNKAYEKLIEAEGTNDLSTQKIIRREGAWPIELMDNKDNCHAYEVKVSMQGADCSMRAELSKQKKCSL